VDGEGAKSDIEERIASLRRKADDTTSDYDREKIVERIAKLGGGVAVIRIGAATEIEMKEAKYRMEDALNATRAAVSEGIIAGGGSAYVHAQKAVLKLADTLEGDEKTGAVIVAQALEAPLRTIVENAGLEGAVVIDKVREQKAGIGFDAIHETYVDMMEDGIIDPVKVTKNALTNAVSVSATLLTTEAAVGDIKEDKPEAAANDMGY
jgi:chaperonin GroEL